MRRSAHPRRPAVMLAVLGLVAALSSPAPLALGAYPGANGLIVMSSSFGDPEGEINLVLAGSDGSLDPTPLTTSPWVDGEASFSPGGTMIAFTRYDGSFTAGEIWMINTNRTGLRRLTNNTADDYYPSWSPDGSRIAFASNRSGDYDVYSMTPTGTDVKALTANASNEFEPSWSPDRTRIAFISDRRGYWELYVMNANGTGQTRLTDSSVGIQFDSWPQWAPDSSKITFHRHTQTTEGGPFDREVMTINPNGSGLTEVVGSTAIEESPAYSPDGSLIIFDANRDDPDPNDQFPHFELYTADSAGGNVQRLTFLGGDQAFDPDWQPIPTFPLVDARFSPFDADIQWIFGQGITAGCSAERYCPDDPVSRGQMAAFLDRALDLPSTAIDFFDDDDGQPFEAEINRLAAAGIASGCGTRLFCPTANVKRDQMASFLKRALNLPATATDFFTDDEGNIHEDNINRVAQAAITSGCGGTNYCPKALVSRGQMAAFLHRAFD